MGPKQALPPIKVYRAITRQTLPLLPQVLKLGKKIIKEMDVVSRVLPFKTNNYVVERLIDWRQAPDDPIFTLTFPQRGMLEPENFSRIERLLDRGASDSEVQAAADEIRRTLNPHPAGQMSLNRPVLGKAPVEGMQHKYRQTVLFFPSQGQTCHAYCTFCFRWAQFVGMQDLRIAAREGKVLGDYLKAHPEVTDVLFTGGDPLIMKTRVLAPYIEELLGVKTLRTIRIGSKALGYWPQRFLTDDDAEPLLGLFRKVAESGRHLALMAHFNHHVELSTPEVLEAIRRVRATGAEIRAQSPVMRGINDDPAVWAVMWQRLVEAGCIPYYMFISRDTGARRFFEISLERAWQIFRGAYQQVSGIARTVRGPSMSAMAGKVQILGVSEVRREKVFVLRFIQGRNPDWVARPFFARFDRKASWMTDLKPAFGVKKFFFEEEFRRMLRRDRKGSSAGDVGEV